MKYLSIHLGCIFILFLLYFCSLCNFHGAEMFFFVRFLVPRIPDSPIPWWLYSKKDTQLGCVVLQSEGDSWCFSPAKQPVLCHLITVSSTGVMLLQESALAASSSPWFVLALIITELYNKSGQLCDLTEMNPWKQWFYSHSVWLQILTQRRKGKHPVQVGKARNTS